MHFLVLGAVLFGLAQITDDGRALGLGLDPITVTAEQVERLRNEWIRETRRAPSRTELDAMVRRYADEEILFREALRLGLDRTDRVVFQRLVRNIRFLRGDPSEGPGADDVAMFEEALALGLNRRDLVVRRRLREAMQERIARTARVAEADVRAYIEAHPARYALSERVGFEHVFLDADRRGTALASDGLQVASQLAAGQPVEGDAFLEGSRFPLMHKKNIARKFGAAFADRVMALPVGTWSEPIASAWGTHLVRVVERREPKAAEYEAVRSRAYYALLAERENNAVTEELARLRRLYPVEVDMGQVLLASQP